MVHQQSSSPRREPSYMRARRNSAMQRAASEYAGFKGLNDGNDSSSHGRESLARSGSGRSLHSAGSGRELENGRRRRRGRRTTNPLAGDTCLTRSPSAGSTAPTFESNELSTISGIQDFARDTIPSEVSARTEHTVSSTLTEDSGRSLTEASPHSTRSALGRRGSGRSLRGKRSLITEYTSGASRKEDVIPRVVGGGGENNIPGADTSNHTEKHSNVHRSTSFRSLRGKRSTDTTITASSRESASASRTVGSHSVRGRRTFQPLSGGTEDSDKKDSASARQGTRTVGNHSGRGKRTIQPLKDGTEDSDKKELSRKSSGRSLRGRRSIDDSTGDNHTNGGSSRSGRTTGGHSVRSGRRSIAVDDDSVATEGSRNRVGRNSSGRSLRGTRSRSELVLNFQEERKKDEDSPHSMSRKVGTRSLRGSRTTSERMLSGRNDSSDSSKPKQRKKKGEKSKMDLEFLHFATSLLRPGGSCRVPQVVNAFRTAYDPIYFTPEEFLSVTDNEIETAMSRWNDEYPKVPYYSSTGIYTGLNCLAGHKYFEEQQQRRPSIISETIENQVSNEDEEGERLAEESEKEKKRLEKLEEVEEERRREEEEEEVRRREEEEEEERRREEEEEEERRREEEEEERRREKEEEERRREEEEERRREEEEERTLEGETERTLEDEMEMMHQEEERRRQKEEEKRRKVEEEKRRKEEEEKEKKRQEEERERIRLEEEKEKKRLEEEKEKKRLEELQVTTKKNEEDSLPDAEKRRSSSRQNSFRSDSGHGYKSSDDESVVLIRRGRRQKKKRQVNVKNEPGATNGRAGDSETTTKAATTNEEGHSSSLALEKSATGRQMIGNGEWVEGTKDERNDDNNAFTLDDEPRGIKLQSVGSGEYVETKSNHESRNSLQSSDDIDKSGHTVGARSERSYKCRKALSDIGKARSIIFDITEKLEKTFEEKNFKTDDIQEIRDLLNGNVPNQSPEDSNEDLNNGSTDKTLLEREEEKQGEEAEDGVDEGKGDDTITRNPSSEVLLRDWSGSSSASPSSPSPVAPIDDNDKEDFFALLEKKLEGENEDKDDSDEESDDDSFMEVKTSMPSFSSEGEEHWNDMESFFSSVCNEKEKKDAISRDTEDANAGYGTTPPQVDSGMASFFSAVTGTASTTYNRNITRSISSDGFGSSIRSFKHSERSSVGSMRSSSFDNRTRNISTAGFGSADSAPPAPYNPFQMFWGATTSEDHKHIGVIPRKPKDEVKFTKVYGAQYQLSIPDET